MGRRAHHTPLTKVQSYPNHSCPAPYPNIHFNLISYCIVSCTCTGRCQSIFTPLILSSYHAGSPRIQHPLQRSETRDQGPGTRDQGAYGCSSEPEKHQHDNSFGTEHRKSGTNKAQGTGADLLSFKPKSVRSVAFDSIRDSLFYLFIFIYLFVCFVCLPIIIVTCLVTLHGGVARGSGYDYGYDYGLLV